MRRAEKRVGGERTLQPDARRKNRERREEIEER